MKKLLLFPFTVLALLIGRFSWSAPPWLTSLDRLAKTYRKGFAALLFFVIAGIGAYAYYDSLPSPLMVKASASHIRITPNHRDAQPDSLEIHFDYDYSVLKKNQPRPSGPP